MPKARVYDSATSQWIYLDAKNSDTVGGKAATDFATANHTHDDRYYTETEIDNKLLTKSDTTHTHTWDNISGKPTTFTPSTHNHDDRYYTETEIDAKLAGMPISGHNHDDRYYTETELQTSGSAIVHWGNISNKPVTYPADAHNHDDRYYTETESDNKYLQKSDNLASLSDKAAARNNLGLGTMATQSTSAFAISTHNHDTTYIRGNHKMTVSNTSPTTPTINDIWIDIN